MTRLPFRPAPANRGGTSSSTPCRFFAARSCREGDRCKFSHAAPPPPTKWSTGPRKDASPKGPCHFFRKGKCREGADCRFLHDEEVVQVAPTDGLKSDNWARELSGAFVQFEDGARVSKVSLRSDFSAVQLTIRPPETEVLWVTQFLRRLDFKVSAESIRVLGKEDDKSKVEVKVEDPSFAARLCRQLQVREDKGVLTPWVIGIPIPVRMPRASNSFRLDRRRVHVSWDAAVRRVYLAYWDKDTAERVYQSFRDGNFSLRGQAITVVDGDAYQAKGWNWVRLDVSPEATRQDISEALPPPLRPLKTEHIYVRDLTYEEDPEAAMAMVLSSLQMHGAIESWEVTTQEASAQVRLKVQFLDENDAQKAAKALHDSKPDFNKNGRLTVEVIYSAKWKVPERIYKVVFSEMESARKDFKSQQLRLTRYPPTMGLVDLKLDGKDNQLVVTAKDSLNRILSFEIAKYDDKVLWSPLFGANGDAVQELRDLESRLNVVIERDMRKSHLRLYGSPGRRLEATSLLADIVKELSEKAQCIAMSDRQADWLRQGGLKAVSQIIGKGNAVLDVRSAPKQLIVNSPEDDYEALLSMVNARKRGLDQNWRCAGTARDDDDCAICFTQADDPVRTACSHIYCRDCFENMCSHAATTGLVCCEGESGQCKTTLGMAELQERLSPSGFEEMLEALFTYYVRHHESLSYCPTPDCPQIYRRTASSDVFNCDKCLHALCTGCQSSPPHEGRTCDEHRDHSTGGYGALKQAKAEYGIKDCPKCETLLEKIDGCNHIECPSCRAHICWVCLASFSTSPECYTHMNSGGHFYGS